MTHLPVPLPPPLLLLPVLVPSGVFHCDRYLAGLDCIWHQGRFVSRSRFEKEAGTSTAKWHCSIKVGGDPRRGKVANGNSRTAVSVVNGGNRRQGAG